MPRLRHPATTLAIYLSKIYFSTTVVISAKISSSEPSFSGILFKFGGTFISISSVSFSILMFTLNLFFLTPHEKILVEAAKSNWACILMGLSITGVEVAFVMIYRAGGEMSTTSLIVNILIALAMLIVGGVFYHEQISAQKIFGVALCIAGVIMLSLR